VTISPSLRWRSGSLAYLAGVAFIAVLRCRRLEISPSRSETVGRHGRLGHKVPGWPGLRSGKIPQRTNRTFPLGCVSEP
jgi:hypothetical protein